MKTAITKLTRYPYHGFMLRKMSLVVTPTESLFDEQLAIRGEELPVNQTVSLVTRLISDKEKFNFSSTCKYKTTPSGTLDVSTQQTLGNLHNIQLFAETILIIFSDGSSYEGVHSMGPLWSMQPERNSRKRYLICILNLVPYQARS